MSPQDLAAAEYMHSLGYLYMRSGQNSRSLVFLLIAYRTHPNHPGILRTLAAAFVANDAGERALNVLDRLADIEGGMSMSATLLRSRALWSTGAKAEARRCFREYVEMRRSE